MMAGTADPPMITRLREVNSLAWPSIQSKRPSHTVGTPAVDETPSASNNAYRLAPSSRAPGSTSLAPTMRTAKGRPHAFNWNLGTMGQTPSLAESPTASGQVMALTSDRLNRWETTPP